MTSNLGSTFLNDLPEGSAIPPATKELVQSSIRSHFLPEFINRIDSIVIFQKLSRKEVRSIVNIRIAEIQVSPLIFLHRIGADSMNHRND